jgi:hypothetical protein
MAVKVISDLFTRMRGTIGGKTYTRNQHVPIIMKQWNPSGRERTPLQGQVVTSFTNAEVDVNAMMDDEQLVALWDDWFSLNFPVHPTWPHQVIPAYIVGVRSFQYYLQVTKGIAMNDIDTNWPAPPAWIGLPELDPISVGAPSAGTGFSLTIKQKIRSPWQNLNCLIQFDGPHHPRVNVCTERWKSAMNVVHPMVVGQETAYAFDCEEALQGFFYFVRLKAVVCPNTTGETPQLAGAWTTPEYIIRCPITSAISPGQSVQPTAAIVVKTKGKPALSA